MEGYIGNKNFVDMEAMRYWQFPLSYKKDKKQETHDLIFSGRRSEEHTSELQSRI